MLTKELIRLLQEADPSGEIECCIANEDIFYVEVKEAYWDGKLQVLVRDETKQCYNIIGAKIVTDGLKLNIRTLSISDAIFNNPDLPVDLSQLEGDGRKKELEEYMTAQRKEAIELREKYKDV